MVLRVITVAFAAMHLGACPYMNNERTDLTGVVNPHTARDSATVTRRTLLKTIQPPRPARTLIFTTLLDFLGDLFATIFNWILSFFGFGPRGEPKTLREAISFGREDIAGLLNDDRAAEVLRLAFHDCTTGICDGCIDLSNLDNGGLADPVEYLKPIVEEYADFLTRGDIWVLASYVALERQQQGPNSVSFDLEFVGRPLCLDPENPPNDNLPSAHINTNGLIDYFKDVFSFTEAETAAIMGAHTL